MRDRDGGVDVGLETPIEGLARASGDERGGDEGGAVEGLS